MSCHRCERVLDEEEDYWLCETESCGHRFCEDCFYEERHEHEVRRVKGKMKDWYLFKYDDPLTGRTVFLGNYRSALPGSQTLTQNNIGHVVSMLAFGDDAEDDLADLRRLYDSSSSVCSNDVRYHLVKMADVLQPSALGPHAGRVLEEATCFVDAGLQKGNVLVHCHKGEKRSPTVLIAWMMTRGVRVTEAIEEIDRSYTGRPGWGDVYRKTRKDWIEELKNWGRDWQTRQKEWSEEIIVEKKK